MSTEPVNTWAILELMGHRRLGGYLTAQEVAGAALLRIDVPTTTGDEEEMVTQFYSPTAIYAITPCSENIARAIAKEGPAPINRWEIRHLLPNPTEEHIIEVDEDSPF